MTQPSAIASSHATAVPAYTTAPAVPLIAPYGIDPQDVPWLADLIARQAVHLFDARHLQDLTFSVSVGPNCTIHTAQLQLNSGPHSDDTTSSGFVVALKQHHRPADLILEIHQLLITPSSQYTNPLLGLVQLGNQGLTCLVVPYHPLGNLRQYLKDQRDNLTALQQMQIIHDIASGLDCLHQRGLQHMNLHSANVLISLQGIALLTDFGRPNSRAEVGMPPKLTPELERIRSLAVVFLAPEVLVSSSYTNRSEVYALGMIMFELLTGRVAFENDLNQPGLSTRIMFGKQDEIPSNIKGSPGFRYEALIKDCWKLNPSERPHLLELKSRLEQLMMEYRQMAEVSKQLPSSTSPAVGIVPIKIAPQSFPESAQYTTTTMMEPIASTSPPNVITTHIIVANNSRAGSEPSSESVTSANASKIDKDKPVEAWTIGLASSSHITQQRDAIPISSRALEISSGHRKNKSISHTRTDQPPIASQIPIPAPVHVTVPAVPVPQYPSPPSPPNSGDVVKGAYSALIASNDHSHAVSTSGYPTASKLNASIPSPTFSSCATPSATPSWPMPPRTIPVNSESDVSSDSEHAKRLYATSPPDVSPVHASIASATTSTVPISNSSQSKPMPIPIPTRTASVTPTTTPKDHSMPRTPISSSSSMSPSSFFNPSRNSILATASAEQQQQDDPLPSFFNWRQMPRIPVDSDAERRRIHSAASPVKVVEASTILASPNTNHSTSTGQYHRQDKVKSFIATLEPVTIPEDAPAEATTVITTPAAAETQVTGVSDSISPQLCNSVERPSRESILIIPVFPEPPSTLHNRRISNMDIQYRSAARKYTGSALQGSGRGNSLAQEAIPGSPVSQGPSTRGAYMPITSSEDVPMATPSNNIYSAARNGDLMELHQFLNEALSRSTSDSSCNETTGRRLSHRGGVSSAAGILDECESIERLPVLCCAAVARKNKYQALKMVLKAGASVESKEQRGGNTPLHLVCETAPPPVVEPTVLRYLQDEHGSRIRAEAAMGSPDLNINQLSMLDVNDDDDDEEVGGGEERLETVLKRIDEQDELEQDALERVNEDSESVFSIATNDEGAQSVSAHRRSSLEGAYYRMQKQILVKGGANPAEIHVDPKTILSSSQKRASKMLRSSGTKLFSSKASGIQQGQGSDDPNHILVMHGSALAHAAYYLRVDCVKYLLEHEIECSDTAVINHAIVACQESVAAKVNPSLAETQKRILRLLEQDWKGDTGRKRRARVAERTLNRKTKPTRSNVLMIALAASSSTLSDEDHSTSSLRTNLSGGTFSLGAIPTTHLYASQGPMGAEIQVISQHGFHTEPIISRYQLSDRPMPTNLFNGPDGARGGADHGHTGEYQDSQGPEDHKSSRMGQNRESRGLFRKMRGMRRTIVA
ncbi:hypothetical protein BG011_006936 [Mortierella polycephala]|uniref:Protein kinase domain-containing protein n=1 Tax=Mortierella polycephala TaxID=41804 RepID=A0A9P6TZC5_9FUNG|nr:hypothetical protein BG011_006936 [Mortierella polycephala]